MDELVEEGLVAIKAYYLLEKKAEWGDNRLFERTSSGAKLDRRLLRQTLRCLYQENLNFLVIVNDGIGTRAVATSLFCNLLDIKKVNNKFLSVLPPVLRVNSEILKNLIPEVETLYKTNWPEVKPSRTDRLVASVCDTLNELHKLTGTEYCFVYETGNKRRRMSARTSGWYSSALSPEWVLKVINEPKCAVDGRELMVISNGEMIECDRPVKTPPKVPSVRKKRKPKTQRVRVTQPINANSKKRKTVFVAESRKRRPQNKL